MTDKRTQAGADTGNMEKDPDDWVTGDEPMTGAQKSYLKTLSEEAHVDFDENLTKAEASRRIDELQQQTGRGRGGEGSGHDRAAQTRSERAPVDDGESANPGSAGASGDEATLSIGPSS
jgi:hypothetical protein